MLMRVREFGASHAFAFPAGSIPAELLTRIGATVWPPPLLRTANYVKNTLVEVTVRSLTVLTSPP